MISAGHRGDGAIKGQTHHADQSPDSSLGGRFHLSHLTDWGCLVGTQRASEECGKPLPMGLRAGIIPLLSHHDGKKGKHCSETLDPLLLETRDGHRRSGRAVPFSLIIRGCAVNVKPIRMDVGGKQWDPTGKETHAHYSNNSRRRKKAHYMLENQPTAIILCPRFQTTSTQVVRWADEIFLEFFLPSMAVIIGLCGHLYECSISRGLEDVMDTAASSSCISQSGRPSLARVCKQSTECVEGEQRC
ncbi:hypothetical protein IRJ41_003308 [Triplophysa rosa]|uniref:Uncharacterized protein n=1 Tax=Triplophysa rosa TaxID=992332 RepID=A0A9W7T714_TRIRA|nr:hypothetical protein IRJ41_003308 [Triplophysa rosa]